MGVAKDEPEGQARVAALREGLEKLGWIDGRNIRIEYRWADGGIDSVRAHTAEMVKLAPELIVANGTTFVDALIKRRERSRSFSCCPTIPSVWVTSRVWQSPAAISQASSLWSCH